MFDTTKLRGGSSSVRRIHPALDFLGDTAYVTVQENAEGMETLVLTSDGEVFDLKDWAGECAKRGLDPRATPDLSDCGARWNAAGIQALANGTLTAPTWLETYDAVRCELDSHLQLERPWHLTYATLLVMMTYFHPLFDFLGITHLRGPQDSGKSRLGDCLAALSFNGAKAGTSSSSNIFRSAHQARPTQVIGECDHLAKLDSGDAEVQKHQAACSKAEANVKITEGGNGGRAFAPVTYYSFSPRVLCSIREFRSAPLRNRSIRLDIVKSAHPDTDRLDRTVADDNAWAPLRDGLYKLLLLRWQEVREALQNVKESWRGEGVPTGRTRDKWLPLATLASLVSFEVLEEVYQLAAADMGKQAGDAEGRFDAFFYQFMRYQLAPEKHWGTRVDDHTRLVSRDDLWHAFNTPLPGNLDKIWLQPPIWLEKDDAAITLDNLKKKIRGPQILLAELQRLNLVPEEITKTPLTRLSRYTLNIPAIEGTIAAYLGPVAETGARPQYQESEQDQRIKREVDGALADDDDGLPEDAEPEEDYVPTTF
jgi:hypothetical protein